MNLTPIDAPDGWESLKPHPVAALFPQMNDAETADLIDSIKQHGFDERRAIVVVRDGGSLLVVDGNNRLSACRLAHVAPVFVEFCGTADELVAMIVRDNLCRRDLSPDAKIQILLKIHQIKQHGRPGVPTRPNPLAPPPRPNPNAKDATVASFTLGVNPNNDSLKSVEYIAGMGKWSERRVLRNLDVAKKAPDRVHEIIRGDKTAFAVARESAPKPPPPPPPRTIDKDELGRPIHPTARPALTQGKDECRAVWNQAAALRRELVKLLASPWAMHMAERQQLADFDNAFRHVKLSAPYTSCPMGDPCGTDCKLCHGSQWITKAQWDHLPPEYRRID